MTYQMGIDVSRWQGVMNWALAKDTLLTYCDKPFAFIRAGSADYSTGACYVDYQFDNNTQNAPVSFSLEQLGFYWYFRPTTDAKKQAQYFVDLIKEKFGEKPYNFKFIIDVEENGGLSPANLTKAIKEFILEVYRLTDIYCMIYTRSSIWNPYTIADPLWEKCEIWVARYKSSLTTPWSDGLYKIRDWDDWNYWQFEADGNGKGRMFGADSDDIDLDYKNDVTSTNPPTEFPYQGTITKYGVNIRNSPVIDNVTNYASSFANRKVTVLDETADGLWLKIEGYIYKQFVIK